VVRIVEQSDNPISYIAKELGISASALRKWVNQARIDETGAPQGALTTTERQELAQLRHDSKRLQLERDFLKNSLRAVVRPIGREIPRSTLVGNRTVAVGLLETSPRQKTWPRENCGLTLGGV
jgi:transposase